MPLTLYLYCLLPNNKALFQLPKCIIESADNCISNAITIISPCESFLADNTERKLCQNYVDEMGCIFSVSIKVA